MKIEKHSSLKVAEKVLAAFKKNYASDGMECVLSTYQNSREQGLFLEARGGHAVAICECRNSDSIVLYPEIFAPPSGVSDAAYANKIFIAVGQYDIAAAKVFAILTSGHSFDARYRKVKAE
jgi:hypothetical protein